MVLSQRAAKCAALMTDPDELYPERILYPRTTRILAKTPVTGGTPIDEETCVALRMLVFGSCASPPKAEWARTGLTLRTVGQNLSFGLRAPRNSTRGLITAVQSIMLKHFLFKLTKQEIRCSPDVLLKPSYEKQVEVLTSAISEIIWRCAGGFAVQSSGCSSSFNSVAASITMPKAIVALPQERPYLQHSVQYFRDGITETLHLYEFSTLDDLEIFIKRYLYLFQDEGSPGAQLLLYSAVLSRGISKIRNDLEDPRASILTGCPEEGPISIVVLAITGRASPHLHNGVIHVGDENTYAIPQWGVLLRSEIGFLVYEGDGTTNRIPGSRLKTPSLPIWVTLCLGHHGILFNTNRELLRNYHAERRTIARREGLPRVIATRAVRIESRLPLDDMNEEDRKRDERHHGSNLRSKSTRHPEKEKKRTVMRRGGGWKVAMTSEGEDFWVVVYFHADYEARERGFVLDTLSSFLKQRSSSQI